MTHARTTRNILASSISRFLPAIAAVALSFGAVSAYAAPIDDLNQQISIILTEEGSKLTTFSTVTVKPDELVYAVYAAARNIVAAANDANTAVDPQKVADLVSAALTAQTVSGKTKARADKDKIAPRVLNAALQGSGLTTGAQVAPVLSALLNVNGGTGALALTAAGKTNTIVQALKSTSADETAGAAFGALTPVQSAVAATDAGRKSFLTSVGKGVGTANGSLASFVSTFVPKFTSTTAAETNIRAAAEAIAASNNTGAGEIIQGYAATLADDAARQSYAATTIVNDSKLVKAQAAAIGGVYDSLSAGTSITAAQFTAAVLAGAPTAKQTVALRGNIASGVLRGLADSSQTGAVVDAALLNKVPTAAEAVSFAGAAAAGTSSDVSRELATKAGNLIADSDVTNLTKLGAAMLKAVAINSPQSGEDVVRGLIASSNTLTTDAFDSNAEKITLAAALAKQVTTSAPTVGFAVAGAGKTLTGAVLSDYVQLGQQSILSNTKAAANIAQEVSGLSTEPLNPITDLKAFAVSLVTNVDTKTNAKLIAPTGAIAAGVAITAFEGNLNNPTLGAGTNPGDIVAAVAAVDTSRQAQLVKIAGTVATAQNPEAVAEIGHQAAKLLNKVTPVGTKYPNSGQLGALATSLAKAINTAPKTTSTNVTPTTNRLDELGELAAEMTRGVVESFGPSATAADLQKALGAVGSSIIKSLSAKYLLNAGGFQADLKDAVGDIAGAIAQTLSVLNVNTGSGQAVSDANLAALLSTAGTTGSLYKTLTTAAKTAQAGLVTAAFNEVNALVTAGNTTLASRLVTGTEALGAHQISAGVSGKYEIGSFIDPETPFKNLP